MRRAEARPTIPTAEDAVQAREASRAIANLDGNADHLILDVSKSGQEAVTVRLPVAAARLLMQVLAEMGEGRAVSVAPTDVEVTTQQAADLLNVSQAYVVGLIEKGELPVVRTVGDQQRLPLADVLDHRDRTRADRLEALRVLTVLDQDHGLR